MEREPHFPGISSVVLLLFLFLFCLFSVDTDHCFKVLFVWYVLRTVCMYHIN